MSDYGYKNEYVVYRVSGRVEDKYSASPIIGGNRMALVCSQTGLHANCCFNAN